MAQLDPHQPSKTFRGTWGEILSHSNEISETSKVELRIFEITSIEEDSVSKTSKAAVSPNEGMLAALREIAERQQGRRHTDGSETERLLREGRAGAMWGHETSE